MAESRSDFWYVVRNPREAEGEEVRPVGAL